MLIVLLAAGLPCLASAEDIPAACLMSFNVKDKTFVAGNATMSCVLMEQRRGEMFIAINKLGATGALDGPAVGQQIAAINARLLKAESEVDWIGWGKSLGGTTLATIGLAACAVPNAGCAFAVVRKVLSVVAVINTAGDETAKRKASAQVRAELDALQKQVANTKPAMDPTRSQLVKESIQLCEAVRQQCLGLTPPTGFRIGDGKS